MTSQQQHYTPATEFKENKGIGDKWKRKINTLRYARMQDVTRCLSRVEIVMFSNLEILGSYFGSKTANPDKFSWLSSILPRKFRDIAYN
jgi:hypothetical protein